MGLGDVFNTFSPPPQKKSLFSHDLTSEKTEGVMTVLKYFFWI